LPHFGIVEPCFMALSIEKIKKIAFLARLNLTPDEEARHAETISAVLDYMKLLDEVDTEKIEPTYTVTGLINIVRDDKPEPSLNKEQLICAMPKVKAGLLEVPGVFKNEDNSL